MESNPTPEAACYLSSELWGAGNQELDALSLQKPLGQCMGKCM